MADQSHAVVYLTEDVSPEVVTALMTPFNDGPRFDRVLGHGADTGFDYDVSHLPSSDSAFEPHVFALSIRHVTPDQIHDHLTALPWGHHGGIAIIDSDHASKIQVRVYGRLTR